MKQEVDAYIQQHSPQQPGQTPVVQAPSNQSGAMGMMPVSGEAGLMMAPPTGPMTSQPPPTPNTGQGNMYPFVAPHLQGHYMPQQALGQPGPHPPKARLQCHACGKLLEYDAGAQYVQCFSCSTMNAVQQKTQLGGRVLSMLCAMCSTTNLAPYGINYVRCGTCHTISQVSHAYRQELPHPNMSQLHNPTSQNLQPSAPARGYHQGEGAVEIPQMDQSGASNHKHYAS